MVGPLVYRSSTGNWINLTTLYIPTSRNNLGSPTFSPRCPVFPPLLPIIESLNIIVNMLFFKKKFGMFQVTSFALSDEKVGFMVPDKRENSAILFLKEGNSSMDPQEIQSKVECFAQKLLDEAQGDPVRALGLLVLVLEGWEGRDGEQYSKLLRRIRKILIPEADEPTSVPSIQHIAGEMSWEGYQHCVRCGKVLKKRKESADPGFPSGHVYQVGDIIALEAPGEFDSCSD